MSHRSAKPSADAALARPLLGVGQHDADGLAVRLPGIERLLQGPQQLLGFFRVVAVAAQLVDELPLMRDARLTVADVLLGLVEVRLLFREISHAVAFARETAPAI